MSYKDIPPEMKKLNQWVVWGIDQDRPKMPFNPASLKPAKAGDPSTWGSYYEAVNRVKCGQAKGIGFEFHSNGIYGVDLDHVLKDGELTPEAAEVVALLDSYTEISPSGEGLHIFVKADGVSLPRNRVPLPTLGTDIECYHEGRYFTVTGNVYGGLKPLQTRTEALQAVVDKYLTKPQNAPAPPMEAPAPVTNQTRVSSGGEQSDHDYYIIGLRNDEVLKAYYYGARPCGNESADDQGFMNKLAYWCNHNAALMKQEFLNSPYFAGKDQAHKEKCTERGDYLDRTIAKAIADTPTTARDNDARFMADRRAATVEGFKDNPLGHQGAVPKRTNAGYTVEGEQEAKYINFSEVEVQFVRWLWNPYLPRGKVCLMQGYPGLGKTTSALNIASIISNGGEFYGESPFEKREPRKVVYQSAEDGVADTLVPRLKKMGANLENIKAVDDSNKSLSLLDMRVEQALKDHHPALFVIDPLQAYLGADVDMHRANEVRPVMARIGALAEQYECTFLIIVHPPKAAQNALYGSLGSADIPAIARSILVVGKDPEDEDLRVLAHVKSSLAPFGQSIAFRLGGETGIEWAGYCNWTADEVMGLAHRKLTRSKPSATKEEAKELLLEIMGDEGYADTKEIFKLAEERGISERTVYNAKKELGIYSHQIGKNATYLSWWTMPDVSKEDSRAALRPAQIELGESTMGDGSQDTAKIP